MNDFNDNDYDYIFYFAVSPNGQYYGSMSGRISKGMVTAKRIKDDIKKNFVLFIIYPSSISLASKFNCNSFHLSYPVLGTLKGWHSLTALKALSAKTL